MEVNYKKIKTRIKTDELKLDYATFERRNNILPVTNEKLMQ